MSTSLNRELEHLIHAIKNDIMGRLNHMAHESRVADEARGDQIALLSAKLEAVTATLGAVRDEVQFLRDSVEGKLDDMAPAVRLRSLVGQGLDAIDAPASGFLNYSGSHDGPLAEAGLWLNPPVVVEWREGHAQIGAVNERIIEQPFAYAALCQLPVGARILDIGGGESTMAFSLASMGYEVTVIEPQGYPFEHPNLTTFTEPLEAFDRSQRFDAVLLLSAIEHFGIGHYRNNPDVDDRADLAAMGMVRDLLIADGLLVLTTPYGPAEVNDVERIYDRERLLALIEGFTIRDVAIGVRTSPTAWTVESHELGAPAGPGRVMMLTATVTPPSATPTTAT